MTEDMTGSASYLYWLKGSVNPRYLAYAVSAESAQTYLTVLCKRKRIVDAIVIVD